MSTQKSVVNTLKGGLSTHKLVELEARICQGVWHHHHGWAWQLEACVAEGVQAAACMGVQHSRLQTGRRAGEWGGLRGHRKRSAGGALQ